MTKRVLTSLSLLVGGFTVSVTGIISVIGSYSTALESGIMIMYAMPVVIVTMGISAVGLSIAGAVAVILFPSSRFARRILV